jgi:phosphoribosylamine--glycine ligase
MEALNKEGRTFKGVIYFQLMLTENGPKVIEYNARFGDPETEAILPLLETDLLDIFEACIDGQLDRLDIQWKNKASATVVLASGGYPEAYQKGYEITGLDDGEAQGLTIYHMGTKTENDKVLTNGGRVLAVTSLGDTVEDAVSKVYNNIERVHFTDMHYRKDIGRK